MRIFKWGCVPNVRLNRPLAVLCVLFALISGCGGIAAPQERHESKSSINEFSQGDITISNAMAPESPLSGGNGAVYMMIHSENEEQLVSAASPAAAQVEIHETIDDNGVMRMVPQPDGIAIPAEGMVELKQGGKHIMLINLTQPLEQGDEIELTLTFREHEPFALTVPIVARGEMNHSNMDHGAVDKSEAGESEAGHDEMNHD